MKPTKGTSKQPKPHPRADPRSPEYAVWRRSLGAGKRRATLKRRERGLLSPAEIATQYALPVSFIRRMVESGALPAVTSGPRRYIWARDAERVLGGHEGTAA
jgi:hypothetical protein